MAVLFVRLDISESVRQRSELTVLSLYCMRSHKLAGAIKCYCRENSLDSLLRVEIQKPVRYIYFTSAHILETK